MQAISLQKHNAPQCLLYVGSKFLHSLRYTLIILIKPHFVTFVSFLFIIEFSYLLRHALAEIFLPSLKTQPLLCPIINLQRFWNLWRPSAKNWRLHASFVKVSKKFRAKPLNHCGGCCLCFCCWCYWTLKYLLFVLYFILGAFYVSSFAQLSNIVEKLLRNYTLSKIKFTVHSFDHELKDDNRV